MENLKILYLNTGIAESMKLGQLLVNRLQDNGTFTIDLYPSTEANQVVIIKFLTQYDIIIFDGTIEKDAKLNNSKYDFLNPSILLRDNFFVVSRNTLPMNIVPPHSNLNQFDALRKNMYKIDMNRFEGTSIDATISNESIVDWIQQEVNQFIETHEESQKPKTALDILKNLKNDVSSVMSRYEQPKKKQIFVSFRGRYQKEKYYDYNVDTVKSQEEEGFLREKQSKKGRIILTNAKSRAIMILPNKLNKDIWGYFCF
jgi:hypothetical protein